MDANAPKLLNGLTNAAVAVKASAGKVMNYDFFNPSAAIAYVQLFDKAQGGVVVGTDTPVLSIGVKAGDRAHGQLNAAFNTAISAAATTGPVNGVAPATALVANLTIR